MDTTRVPQTDRGDHEQDHPHACNDGWVMIGQMVLDPETGAETLEEALYLCRRCADAK